MLELEAVIFCTSLRKIAFAIPNVELVCDILQGSIRQVDWRFKVGHTLWRRLSAVPVSQGSQLSRLVFQWGEMGIWTKPHFPTSAC